MASEHKRILLIGPGAIGGTVAAWLIEAGHDVTLAVRTPFDRLHVETPDLVLETQAKIVTDPGAAGEMDWALVATKTYDAEAAAQWLRPLVPGSARFAILQNGVEHLERFAPYVPKQRILPVMVDIPAERDAPGVIRQRGKGIMQVPAGTDGRDFAALFADTALDVTEVDDFTTALWRKLCINVAGAVSALTGEAASVAWREPAAGLMRALVRECVAVGRAEGATLDDSIANAVVEHYRKQPPDCVNSLHADLRAGRPMEWDARNGAVTRFGLRHSIPTLVNDTISSLLEAIDERHLCGTVSD